MITVKENREDLIKNKKAAKEANLKIEPEYKPIESSFYDFAKRPYMTYTEKECKIRKSPFIDSLFSNNDESIVGEKPKIRQYVKKMIFKKEE